MRHTTNRHPVDRLAEVREQIRALEKEGDELKDRITLSKDFVGAEYLAQAAESTRTTLDRAKLEATFGKTAVAACSKVSTCSMLRLRKRARNS